MENKKTGTVAGIIIVLLIVLGITIYFSVAARHYQPPRPNPDHSLTLIDQRWQELSTSTITTLLKGAKIQSGLEPNTTEYATSTDLTGDGRIEGVFVTWRGATGYSANVFDMATSGVRLLNEKDQYNEVAALSLTDVSSATYRVSYVFLPIEHGYYVYSFSNAGATELGRPRAVCEKESFSAYQWSASTEQFEWNKQLTDKYRMQVCG